MEGRYRGSLLNFMELSGKQSLPRTMQRRCICVEEPHIQNYVFSGKVPYEDKNSVASWHISCLEPPVQVTKLATQSVREILTLPP
jgi:hypothetical protein